MQAKTYKSVTRERETMDKGNGGEPGKRQCRGGSNNTRSPAELSALSGQAIIREAPSFCEQANGNWKFC